MRKIGCFWLVGVLCFGQLAAGGEFESGDVKGVLIRGYKEAQTVFDDVRMVCLLKSWHDSAWWKAELDFEMESEVQYSAW